MITRRLFGLCLLAFVAGCPAPSEPGGLALAPGAASPSPSPSVAPASGFSRFEGEDFSFYYPAAWERLPQQPLTPPSRELVNLQGEGAAGRVSFYVVAVGPAHEPFEAVKARTLEEVGSRLIASEDSLVDGVSALAFTADITHGGYEYKQGSYLLYHRDTLWRIDFYHPKDAPDSPDRQQDLAALIASWRWRASTDQDMP